MRCDAYCGFREVGATSISRGVAYPVFCPWLFYCAVRGLAAKHLPGYAHIQMYGVRSTVGCIPVAVSEIPFEGDLPCWEPCLESMIWHKGR